MTPFAAACPLIRKTPNNAIISAAALKRVIYIGGCKVTVRYSGQKNPSAVKRIKDTLIAGATAGKS